MAHSNAALHAYLISFVHVVNENKRKYTIVNRDAQNLLSASLLNSIPYLLDKHFTYYNRSMCLRGMLRIYRVL